MFAGPNIKKEDYGALKKQACTLLAPDSIFEKRGVRERGVRERGGKREGSKRGG